jgi:hypothetical protein
LFECLISTLVGMDKHRTSVSVVHVAVVVIVAVVVHVAVVVAVSFTEVVTTYCCFFAFRKLDLIHFLKDTARFSGGFLKIRKLVS